MYEYSLEIPVIRDPEENKFSNNELSSSIFHLVSHITFFRPQIPVQDRHGKLRTSTCGLQSGFRLCGQAMSGLLPLR